MAFASLGYRSSLHYLSPVFTCCSTTSSPVLKVNPWELQQNISRRMGITAVTASVMLAAEAFLTDRTANGFEFRMTVPEQTVEEAESMIRDHAKDLLDVKSLIESESWREAQRELRKNAAYLKQDIYTIIQSKEGSIRPLLRKLYSDLFNNVTKMDFAARDKDATRVSQCYNDVAASLKEILSRI